MAEPKTILVHVKGEPAAPLSLQEQMRASLEAMSIVCFLEATHPLYEIVNGVAQPALRVDVFQRLYDECKRYL